MCWLLWDLSPGWALCSLLRARLPTLSTACASPLVGGVRMVPWWPLPREGLEGTCSLKHYRAAPNWGPQIPESMRQSGSEGCGPSSRVQEPHWETQPVSTILGNLWPFPGPGVGPQPLIFFKEGPLSTAQGRKTLCCFQAAEAFHGSAPKARPE